MSKTEVPNFETVDALRGAITNQDGSYDLYPRDGNRGLWELESQFAELARVEAGELLLCASGMAAVVGSVRSCLEADSVIALAEQTYSQTQVFANNLAQQGHKVYRFDSGDPESVHRTISQRRPSIILSETVGNGPDVPLLDIQKLLDSCDEVELDPHIILDNTLPLSTGCDVTGIVGEDRKLLVIESGTKSYAFNKELVGLVYSKNEAELQKVRKLRQIEGFGLNLGAIAPLEAVLPRSLGEFDARNERVFKNCRLLAAAAFAAERAEGSFVTSHPALRSHPNQQLTTEDYKHGATPVFFLQCTGSVSQYELAERLWSSEAVRSRSELGQSFGFDEARILPNANYPIVRIAAGAEDDASGLACAIKRALE